MAPKLVRWMVVALCVCWLTAGCERSYTTDGPLFNVTHVEDALHSVMVEVVGNYAEGTKVDSVVAMIKNDGVPLSPPYLKIDKSGTGLVDLWGNEIIVSRDKQGKITRFTSKGPDGKLDPGPKSDDIVVIYDDVNASLGAGSSK